MKICAYVSTTLKHWMSKSEKGGIFPESCYKRHYAPLKNISILVEALYARLINKKGSK